METLQLQYAAGDKTFDDLDALAGTWSKPEAAEFAAAVAPFAEIEAGLWAAEPKATYGVRPAAKSKSRK